LPTENTCSQIVEGLLSYTVDRCAEKGLLQVSQWGAAYATSLWARQNLSVFRHGCA